jgi:hypothetical protein
VEFNPRLILHEQPSRVSPWFSIKVVNLSSIPQEALDVVLIKDAKMSLGFSSIPSRDVPALP